MAQPPAKRNAPQTAPISKSQLIDYYYLLRKRAWLIGSIAFVVALATALITFSTKPVYQATATILVDKEDARSPLTGESMDAETYVSQQLTYRTQFKLVTSRPILEKVLKQVNLPDDLIEEGAIARYFSAIEANVKRFVALVSPPSRKDEVPFPEESDLAAKVDQLADMIRIEEIRDTRLLKIHVEDIDPQKAQIFANAVADNFILYDADMRLQGSRKIIDWLSDQLYDMKKKVEDSEKAFLNFKEQEKIFTIEGQQKLNSQKIEDMNSGYVQARSQRLELEAKIEELKRFIVANDERSIKSIPTFINNELLQSLYADLLNTEVEYQKIAGIYKGKHPEMLKVTSKISELRAKIRQQLEKTLENAEAERAVLVARENALQQAMDSYESDAITSNRKELQYSILQRDVESSKELYNILLTKIKEANITEGITKTNLRLVEPATLPMMPIKPKKARNMMLGVFLGVLGGVGMALLLENLDQTVHNRDEAESRIGAPVLAEVPIEASKARAKANAEQRRPFPLLGEQSVSKRFTEAFRTLVTNLQFSEMNRHGGVYLVTSSIPGEGKSTVSLNLALAMSDRGMRTLVIEGDMRMPVMKRTLGGYEEDGLTGMLVNTFRTEIKDGALGEWTIADLHRFIEIQEKTGVLRYENEQNSFKVSFYRGRVIDVDWPSRPKERRLGSILLLSGKITKDQLDLALARQRDTGQRLGLILLHMGFIDAEELAGPLKLQIQENIRELYRCNKGRFTFHETTSLLAPIADARESALIAAMGPIETNHQRTPILYHQLERQMHHIPDSNLWVLPCGKTPPNPPELLASSRMRVLLELLRQQFECIVIDSPPVGTVSDASVLAPYCDGVIFVVKTGETNSKEIQRAREQLQAVNAPVLGSVLNMLDFKRNPYYGYYYGKYNRYYGKEDDEKQETDSGKTA